MEEKPMFSDVDYIQAEAYRMNSEETIGQNTKIAL